MLLLGPTAGAQALVAWSLQQAFPNAPLQMVAEEDAADLRCVRQHSHLRDPLETSAHCCDHCDMRTLVKARPSLLQG